MVLQVRGEPRIEQGTGWKASGNLDRSRGFGTVRGKAESKLALEKAEQGKGHELENKEERSRVKERSLTASRSSLQ